MTPAGYGADQGGRYPEPLARPAFDSGNEIGKMMIKTGKLNGIHQAVQDLSSG
jgi:hypothetical protein